MKNHNLLLIIDVQNDFCTSDGALFIDGAEKDLDRLCDFVNRNSSKFSEIILSMDTHNVVDIAHPCFWEKQEGEQIEEFTNIKYKDIIDGKYLPRYFKSEAIEYIQKLENKAEYSHIIWPEHCINGSYGAAIPEKLMHEIKNWARLGKNYEIIQKGLNPLTEHFGILRANIPNPADESTKLNMDLIKKLKSADRIFISGQAKSHCVANTVKQICEQDSIISKTILLEDTMSDAPGCKDMAKKIYDKAVEQGMRICKSTEFKF
ncbi:MAG: hypothetical protein N4A49_04695 [Marinifilaceae bacterium]|jgi:nicotinamidase-related amidase|nr:hypothetical protein [Marinifilaceae bacterium]